MYKVLNNIYKTPNVVSKILSREVVKKKKIVIDFSSPNIAKRFHIGNLRSTLIGDYIKNINQLSHNEVISINYLGDWGTQFGIILLPFMKDKELIFKYENFTNEVDKMKFITDLYVEYNKVIQEDEEKRNEGKKIFENLEKYYKGEFKVNSDIEYQLKIIDIIRKSSIEYLEEFYNKMNISFNYWAGESNIIGEAHKIVEELRRRNEIETTKDGLSIVRYPDSNNYGCVMKSDGSSLYLTRDVAEVLRRDKLFNGDNYYYVVDRSQISHFECLKMILCKLGREDLSDKVKHIYFGRVKGLSTRNGRTKAVDDIIMEGEKLSLKYVKSSPTIKVDKESDLLEISNNLAVSTIKINEYQRKITSEYEFSFKDAFKEKGRNALLFQTRYSRLCSIIRNNAEYYNVLELNEPFTFDLNYENTTEIEKFYNQINKLETILIQSYKTLEPSVIVVYLSELSSILGPLIKNLRISQEGKDIGTSRLLLFVVSRNIFKELLLMLGVKPLEKM